MSISTTSRSLPRRSPASREARELLGSIRDTAEALRAGQRDLFLLAAAWADAHPDPDAPDPVGDLCDECRGRERESWFDYYAGPVTDPERGPCLGACVGNLRDGDEGYADPHLPSVAWDAAAPFGTAIGRSTTAASAMIRDALLVRHRLPTIWTRVVAGQVTPAKARMIAREIIDRPSDVSTMLDTELAPIAHRIGEKAVKTKIDEAMLRWHAELREIEQIEALDRQHATLDPTTINHLGLAEMSIHAEWKDLADFDETLTRVAAALATHDAAAGRPPASHDVRRARAVGILADPATALALLNGDTAPAPRKRIKLVFHITDANILGCDPVATAGTTIDGTRPPILEQTLRDWCARTDTHLTVQPVLDLAAHNHTYSYRPHPHTQQRTELIAHTCVFPHCTRPAHTCDHDHTQPYNHHDPDHGGPTCDCNIAPLCRHHHQLKTHAGWTYHNNHPPPTNTPTRHTPTTQRTWTWTDPHGNSYLREPTG